jgi:hypothetical protein
LPSVLAPREHGHVLINCKEATPAGIQIHQNTETFQYSDLHQMSRAITKKARVQDVADSSFQTMACQIIQQNHEAGIKTKSGKEFEVIMPNAFAMDYRRARIVLKSQSPIESAGPPIPLAPLQSPIHPFRSPLLPFHPIPLGPSHSAPLPRARPHAHPTDIPNGHLNGQSASSSQRPWA